jgi:hypothetical protein
MYQEVPVREHLKRSGYSCRYCNQPAQVVANRVRVLHVRGCWLGDYLRRLGIIGPTAKYGKVTTA